MASDMFKPPVNRTMQVLERSFFQKRIPLSALRVLDTKQIGNIRNELDKSKDVLWLPRYQNIQEDHSEGSQGHKCVLLRPKINEEGQAWPWSKKVDELQSANHAKMVPFEVQLDYKYWTYAELADAILPNADTDEVPSSFQVVGHVAHLNLREQYKPYKHLIAEMIRDKNPGIHTVINKIDDVGEENEFRTFRYEVLAGPDDLNVEVKEQNCSFKFDYAKVYWNSRLSTEHERLVTSFHEGEAVCDVMAGIGPFAIPAAKKKVFVWANDLNPESHRYLCSGAVLNKVQDYVRPFNADGRKFIKAAARQLYETDHVATERVREPTPKGSKATPTQRKYKEISRTQPKFFSHYVMNLPASATDFLPAFVGLYHGFGDIPDSALPMVHCYCFETKSDDNVQETRRICELVSHQIGSEITPDTRETRVWDVRDVAPKKRMFCVSFRLPREVALRAP